jgi:hypothetical protein
MVKTIKVMTYSAGLCIEIEFTLEALHVRTRLFMTMLMGKSC